MESIGHKIRGLREQKGLSQGDIERTTGMLRCYISRVEHGYTVPSVETLERFAAALGIPVYQFFLSRPLSGQDRAAPVSEREQGNEKFLRRLGHCIRGMGPNERLLLLDLAEHLVAKQPDTRQA